MVGQGDDPKSLRCSSGMGRQEKALVTPKRGEENTPNPHPRGFVSHPINFSLPFWLKRQQ